MRMYIFYSALYSTIKKYSKKTSSESVYQGFWSEVEILKQD